MTNKIFFRALLAGSALSLVAVSAAHAGGFALREQSAYGQGSSFAGVAAGGSASSMYWNPATITQFDGKTAEQNITFVLPSSEIETTSATGPFAAPLRNSGSMGMFGIIPTGASVYQFSDRIYLGVSSSAPYGLATDANDDFSGRIFGSTGKVLSANISPTVGFKVTDQLSVAVGAQIQYFRARLNSPVTDLEGDDIGFGFTAGVLFTPTERTSFGIGFRSSVSHTLEGDATSQLNAAFTGGASAKLKTPDLLTIGVRHKVNDRWTVMGGFEWANWSRLQQVTINYNTTASITEDFHWDDGYYFSLGAEYDFSEQTQLRFGVGYELSPVNDSNRGVRIPDNDRLWLSTGVSHMINDHFTLHAGYSLVLAKEGNISLTNPTLASSFTGKSTGFVNILSLGVTGKF